MISRCKNCDCICPDFSDYCDTCWEFEVEEREEEYNNKIHKELLEDLIND